MLARLVAERWNGGSSGVTQEIFIDRCGARFDFVLDYLRDGQVHIPLGVSKAAVMNDLQYFGFTVDEQDVVAERVVDHDGLETQLVIQRTQMESWLGERLRNLRNNVEASLVTFQQQMTTQLLAVRRTTTTKQNLQYPVYVSLCASMLTNIILGTQLDAAVDFIIEELRPTSFNNLRA